MRTTENFAVLDLTQSRVREAVLWYRTHGYRREDSLSAVASDLGLSPWLTKAYFYRDLRVQDETRRSCYACLMERWGKHLEARMAALAREVEEIRIAQQKHQNFLGRNKCGEPSGLTPSPP